MAKSAEAFRTISEVADDLGIQKHVLRFWEVKFAQIRPMKRGGGRRYYRPEDMELLRGIRQLLHRDGYTIRGVQKILREQGVEAVKQRALAGTKPEPDEAEPPETTVSAGSATRAAAASRQARGRGKKRAADGIVDRMAVLQMAIDELAACRDLLMGKQAKASPAARKKAPARGRRSA